jgi:hypothetical protein
MERGYSYHYISLRIEELPFIAEPSQEVKSKFLPFTILSCAELNVLAATNSVNASAYEHALQYVDTGLICFISQVLSDFYSAIELIRRDEDRSWQEHHSFCFELFKMKAELLKTCLKYDAFDKTCTYVLEHSKSILEQSEAYLALQIRYENDVRLTYYVLFQFNNILFLCSIFGEMQ